MYIMLCGYPPFQGDSDAEVMQQVRLGKVAFEEADWVGVSKDAQRFICGLLKYKPEDNAQMRGLAPLVWDKTDYAQLERGPNLCHVWDASPIVVDTGLPRLSMWSGWGVEKGTLHISTGVIPQPGQNWAKLWANAIVNATLPEGTTCDTWELDGFWQQQWFFMDHIDLVREAFWHQPTADKAAEVLKWLMYNEKGHQPVGIHIRLGDYKFTNRNMPITYYHDAVNKLKHVGGDDRPMSCLIFSDDIEEAMEFTRALDQCDRRVPVPTDFGEEYSFYMMGLMPKIIIADSSFSFWAARLAPHDPIVVAPGIYKDNANAQSAYDYLLQTPGWILVNTTTDIMYEVARSVIVGTDAVDPNVSMPKVSALQFESSVVDDADAGAARYARRAMSEWAY